jgi:hypothetical protein
LGGAGESEVGQRREMHYGIDRVFAKDTAKFFAIRQVAFNERCPIGHGIAVTSKQRIVDANFEAALEKLFGCNAANVSGAAGNKNHKICKS